MARAQSFLVNNNPIYKDTSIIDMYIEPRIFLNNMVRHKMDLEQNMQIIDIDSRYDYRPDRLAFEMYGQDFWYPAILALNNMGSMLQFKASTLGYKCKIPDFNVIQKLINTPVQKLVTVDDIVDEIFK